MNNSSSQDENLHESFSYESALPISNGKLGMLLFISTEVMLFTAIIASYIVLRFSGTYEWPTAEQVHLDLTLGIINTLILMASGIAMWLAVKRCGNDNAAGAKFWLLATVILGGAFLGIKFLEYKQKYDHGIFPSRDRSLIYNLADDTYLSRAVLEMRQEIQRIEQLPAGDNLEQKQSRLDDLYLLQSGIVDWTQYIVGRSGDTEIKRKAIGALAHQIYSLKDDPEIDSYLESEVAAAKQEKIRLATQLSSIESSRTEAQKRLRELLPKKDSGDEQILREYERVAETVSRLTDEITSLNKDILPLENRLKAIENVSKGPGINETYGVRLPVVIPGGHKWSSLYYLLTGTHAVHLIAGLLALLFLLFCRLNVRWHGVMENVGLYWHFVDVVWLVVFAVIYLM